MGKIKTYKIEDVPTEDIKFDGHNPNKMSKEEEKALEYSMEKFGFLMPVVLDKNYIVADGEHKVTIMKNRGETTVQCYVLHDISIGDRKLIRQVLNKLRGKHQKDLDEEELKRLMEENADSELLALLPNHNKELKQMIDKINGDAAGEEKEFNPKEEYEKIEKAITKPGDIIELGEHRLMCGDSTEQKNVQKLMGKDRSDMTFIDPPYNLAFSGTTKGQFYEMDNDNISAERYDEFITKLTDSFMEYSKENASHYLCIDFRNYHKWVNYFEKQYPETELINCIVWDKVFAGMGYKYRFRHEFIMFLGNREKVKWFGTTTEEDIFKMSIEEMGEGNHIIDMKGITFPLRDGRFLRVKLEDNHPQRVPLIERKEIKMRTDNQSDTDIFEGFSMNYFSQRELEHAEGIVHPTMKPIRLINQVIRNSSEKGDVILDFCGGSGSTLIAAEQTGRNCRMMEIDPKYCDVIIKRWEQYTGQEAKRL